MPRWSYLLSFLVAWLASGCSLLFGGLDVETVASSAAPPSNVAVYVAVSDGKEPVADLSEQNFHLFENDQPLDTGEAQLTLLDRQVSVLHRVVLLVDVSGAKDDNARRQLARGAAGFVAAVRERQAVTVFAFDGSENLKLIGEYPKGKSSTPEELTTLASYQSKDPSRNLNGAVLKGLRELDARLMTEKKPVRVGTLVVFTAGPDLAGRTSGEKLAETLDSTPHQVVAVGIGDDSAQDNLDVLGKDGVTRAPSVAMAGIGLDEAATRVNALYGKYYLVSYCSPARAGKRRLRIEVQRTTLEGDEEKGSVEVDFDATGFGPGCDPTRPPRFVKSAAAQTDVKPPPVEGNEPPPDKPKTDTEKPKQGPAPDDEGIVPPPDKPGFAPLPEPKK